MGLWPPSQKDLLVFCAVSCFCGLGRTLGAGGGEEMDTPQLPVDPLTSTQPLGDGWVGVMPTFGLEEKVGWSPLWRAQ